MKQRYYLLNMWCSLIGLFLFTGCIEEFEADLSSDETQILAVEGTIFSDSLCNFYLSQSRELNSESGKYLAITDAKLSVKGSDGSEYPVKNAETEGEYAIQMPKLNEQVEYWLHIEHHGDIYESLPAKPITTEAPDSVVFKQASRKSNVDVLINTKKVENTNTPLYYQWKLDETWEVRPVFSSNWYYDEAKQTAVHVPNLYPARGWMFGHRKEPFFESTVHYADQQMKNYKLYDIARSDARIFYMYSGLIHQRSISKAEYEYRLACRQASSEMGGLFSPQGITLPTNLRCVNGDKRVIGFVGVAMNECAYRFYIDGNKVLGKEIPLEPELLDSIDPPHEACVSLIHQGYRIYHWFEEKEPPFAESDFILQLHTIWAPEKYFDIRLQGATDKKPEYMP